MREIYPALDTQALYILKDTVDKLKRIEIDGYMQACGYTQEDYQKTLSSLGIEAAQTDEAGFVVPVEYALTADGFTARILMDKVTEQSDRFTLQQIRPAGILRLRRPGGKRLLPRSRRRGRPHPVQRRGRQLFPADLRRGALQEIRHENPADPAGPASRVRHFLWPVGYPRHGGKRRPGGLHQREHPVRRQSPEQRVLLLHRAGNGRDRYRHRPQYPGVQPVQQKSPAGKPPGALRVPGTATPPATPVWPPTPAAPCSRTAA